MDCSMTGFPIHCQLLELTQTHVHWASDAIQPSHPLSSPFPPTFNLSQPQGLFQWVSSLHQVAKVLELQLQHPSFQWIFRVDFLQDWLIWSPCFPRVLTCFCFINIQRDLKTPSLHVIASHFKNYYFILIFIVSATITNLTTLQIGVIENIPCHITDLIHIDDHLKIGPINRPQLNNDIRGFMLSSAGKESTCNAGDLVGKIPSRRAWQPTPVFLPGEPHGWRSLAGYSPRSCKTRHSD